MSSQKKTVDSKSQSSDDGAGGKGTGFFVAIFLIVIIGVIVAIISNNSSSSEDDVTPSITIKDAELLEDGTYLLDTTSSPVTVEIMTEGDIKTVSVDGKEADTCWTSSCDYKYKADNLKIYNKLKVEAKDKKGRTISINLDIGYNKNASDSTYDDALDYAAGSCERYAEAQLGVNIQLKTSTGNMRKKTDNGQILIKSRIVRDDGLFNSEVELGTMECYTSSDGMTVEDIIFY